MKLLIVFLSAALALAATPAPASAAFFLTNTKDGDGYVVDGPEPYDFTLFGADNDARDNRALYGTEAQADRTISGSFRYTTHDTDGSFEDQAGYFINRTFFRLSSTHLVEGESNSGTFSFLVNEYDRYGFYVASGDSALGRGEISIGFSGVPEPAAWALMIAGFGGVGSALRRRRVALRAT